MVFSIRPQPVVPMVIDLFFTRWCAKEILRVMASTAFLTMNSASRPAPSAPVPPLCRQRKVPVLLVDGTPAKRKEGGHVPASRRLCTICPLCSSRRTPLSRENCITFDSNFLWFLKG